MKRVIKASEDLHLKISDYYISNASYLKVCKSAGCTVSEIANIEDYYSDLGFKVVEWLIAKPEYFDALESSGFEVVPIVTESRKNILELRSEECFPAQVVKDRVYDATDEILDIVSSIE